ncbi:unnamed protein product, partial [marine sediment metagenome]
NFGGNVVDFKFAKLDLGEGADAWLFNGDVFFNGNGRQNRVTFSPNVIFRDDVFVYGSMFADQLTFNFANVFNMRVRNNLIVEQKAHVRQGLAIGDGALDTLNADQGTNPNLLLYNKGDAKTQNMILESENTSLDELGGLYFKGKRNPSAQVFVGGEINNTLNPFGIHFIDGRAGVDLDTASSFNDLVLDYSDGNGNYGNVNLVVRGDLSTTRGFLARYLAVGDVDAVNTDYVLYANGRVLINDVLEVKALRFIGAEAPEGQTDIVTPSNVIVVDKGSEETHNNENILREKKFTITERVYLNNEGKLGTTTTNPEEYYNAMLGTTGAQSGYWGHDTLTYTEDEFDAFVAQEAEGVTENEIVVPELNIEASKRYRYDRIIIATLGTLKVEWTGYAYDPNSDRTGSEIQRYVFESPYFRNRNGSSQINWMPGDTRFGDENLVVRVTGDLIDTHPSSPDIFKLDAPLSIYIPKTAWMEYGPEMVTTEGYRSFVVFYPYENVINNLNVYDFTNQTNLCGFVSQAWRLGIYP